MKQVTASEFDSVVVSAPRVIVKFTAVWCPPCKALAPVLEQVAKELNVLVVEVDADEETDLVARFKVRGLPTTLFFKDGTITDTIVGMTSKENIVKATGV